MEQQPPNPIRIRNRIQHYKIRYPLTQFAGTEIEQMLTDITHHSATFPGNDGLHPIELTQVALTWVTLDPVHRFKPRPPQLFLPNEWHGISRWVYARKGDSVEGIKLVMRETFPAELHSVLECAMVDTSNTKLNPKLKFGDCLLHWKTVFMED